MLPPGTHTNQQGAVPCPPIWQLEISKSRNYFLKKGFTWRWNLQNSWHQLLQGASIWLHFRKALTSFAKANLQGNPTEFCLFCKVQKATTT